jgi:hypothetical protein
MTDETRGQLELPIEEGTPEDHDTAPHPYDDFARRQLTLFDPYEQVDLPLDLGNGT